MIRTKQVHKEFTVSRMVYQVDLPAGLRCKPITEGTTAGKFFLDELPLELFPANSFIRHDATYYGIVLEPEEVQID